MKATSNTANKDARSATHASSATERRSSIFPALYAVHVQRKCHVLAVRIQHRHENCNVLAVRIQHRQENCNLI